MKTLLSSGGPLFSDSIFTISILTLILIILIAWSIYHGLPIIKNQRESFHKLRDRINYLKSIGLFALIIGVFDQLIGLYSIFSAIEEAADINARIVFQSLKTSMVPLLYAIFIYVSSIIIWISLDFLLKSKMRD